MQFVLAVWREVLTAGQSAHLHVVAFPGFADALRIAESVARDAGQPPSCTLLSRGAVRLAGSLDENSAAWAASGLAASACAAAGTLSLCHGQALPAALTTGHCSQKHALRSPV